MSVEFILDADTGGTFVVTVERISDGYFWNETTSAFASAPAFADKKIALAEGSAENLRSYTGTAGASLGSPGWCRVRWHDDADANDVTVAVALVYIDSDAEVVSQSVIDAITGAPVGTVTGTPSATSIQVTGADISSTDDTYNSCYMKFISGNLKGVSMPITDFVGSTKTFTTSAFPFAPAVSDLCEIGGYHT